MPYYKVRGGTPLKGSVTISGAKNAAIKMIAASLLTSEEVHLSNIPQIEDVRVDLEVARSLGVKVEEAENELRLKADDIGSFSIPEGLSQKTRAAIITLGPLLARFGKATLPPFGGCPIGERPVDRHLKALEALGAKISCASGAIEARAERLVGAPIRFSKTTVMGTENAILASVLAEGETTILGAAQEPEVDDLIELLIKMGAKIERSEEDPGKILIEGVENLSGAAHEVLPDRNEAVTFAVAAAATRGDVTLERVRPQDLTSFLSKFETVGASYEVTGEKIRVWADSEVSFSPVDIETAPHPGFATDWQQPFAVLLTQAEGESVLHETVHGQRFNYLSELSKMGAKVELLTPTEAGIPFDIEKYGFNWPFLEENPAGETRAKEKPSRFRNPNLEGWGIGAGGESPARELPTREPKVVAKITGPRKLHGAEVKISDLRAGATLVIAALAAEGESKIFGIEHIDRGYENFEEKLRGLGAEIERAN